MEPSQTMFLLTLNLRHFPLEEEQTLLTQHSSLLAPYWLRHQNQYREVVPDFRAIIVKYFLVIFNENYLDHKKCKGHTIVDSS